RAERARRAGAGAGEGGIRVLPAGARRVSCRQPHRAPRARHAPGGVGRARHGRADGVRHRSRRLPGRRQGGRRPSSPARSAGAAAHAPPGWGASRGGRQGHRGCPVSQVRDAWRWLADEPRHRQGIRIVQITIGLVLLYRLLTEAPFAAYLWGPNGVGYGSTGWVLGPLLGGLLDHVYASEI